MFSLRPEFLQQPFVAERFYVHVFLWVGDNPAVLGLGLQQRVFLGQVAQFLELHGEIGKHPIDGLGDFTYCRPVRSVMLFQKK